MRSHRVSTDWYNFEKSLLFPVVAGKANVKMENVNVLMDSLATIVKIVEPLAVKVSVLMVIAPNQSPAFAILDFPEIFVK